MPVAVVIVPFVCHPRADLWVEIGVFAEAMEGGDVGGAAVGWIRGRAEHSGDGLLGAGAETFGETAMTISVIIFATGA